MHPFSLRSQQLNHRTTASSRFGDLSKAGLAVSNLVPLVQELFTAGIASSTRKVYGTGASRYTKFCEATSLSAYPTSENTLMLFVAHLHSEGLAPGTIKSYLAGVRHDQIRAGLGNPCIAQMPQLEYVLKGVKRLAKPSSYRRLPITPPILWELKRVWEKDAANADNKMLWAASCLCFFGFLRSGKAAAPKAGEFDPHVHLCQGDIRVDSHKNSTFLQV